MAGAGLGAGDLAWRAAGGNSGLAQGKSFSVFNPATLREAAHEFFNLFRSNPPIQVTIDPHTAAHAQAAAASGANPPPPEHRR